MVPKSRQKPTTKSLAHPMQPIGWDGKGVIRFKPNAIVEHFLHCAQTGRKYDLNDLALDMARGTFTREDYSQFSQLHGYSVSGFGELNDALPRIVAEADRIADAIYKDSGRTRRTR